MSRSALFRAYNRYRHKTADTKRLNRALGLAQRKEGRPYQTSPEDCNCPDQECRRHLGIVCKHRLAVILRELANEQEKEESRK